jgi:BlaI family transcriptional regulator, penicillinase repressor
MTHPPRLSKRESQIMDIIYARGQATATDVLATMPDGLSRTAVRTFLRILEGKGHLTHRTQGREYVFAPTQPRRQMGQSALRRVLEVFFGGSLEQAVATYLAEKNGPVREQELEQIAALIRRARKEGR